MYNTLSHSLSLRFLPRYRAVSVVFAAIGAAATLVSATPASAHNLSPLTRVLYAAEFTCGSQRALSVNLPTPLQTGSYSFSLGVFNASTTSSNNISVFAALPDEPPVLVETYSLAAFENTQTDCAEILGVLGVTSVPNAVVGYLHLTRQEDNLEVQAVYSRTASSNGSAAATPVGGASVDVERIQPRMLEIVLSQAPTFPRLDNQQFDPEPQLIAPRVQ